MSLVKPFAWRNRGLGALAALCLLVGAASAQAEPVTREWRFRAFLGEEPIGHHGFRVLARGQERELVTEAQFDVKLLFINAYRYRHQNRELWDGQCLQSLRSSTNDNGEHYTVAGDRQADHFTVTTPAGTRKLPACVMSFAYWDPQILEQSHLLNTQSGEYVPVRAELEGEEPLEIGGLPTWARRYRLQAGAMQIWLWYSASGEWLALRTLTERGDPLTYRLEAPPTLVGSSTP